MALVTGASKGIGRHAAEHPVDGAQRNAVMDR